MSRGSAGPRPPAPDRDGAESRPFLLRNWKVVLGIVVSAALLYYALHDVPFGEVIAEVGTADPLLFFASVAVTTSAFFIRAVRWKPLLDPVKSTRFGNRFAATAIGFMANNVLPARIGEFARAVSMSRLERVPITASLGSLVIERIFDGLTIVAFLFLATTLPSFPVVLAEVSPQLSAFVTTMMVILAAAIALLVSMVFWPQRVTAGFEATIGRLLPERIQHEVHAGLQTFMAGLGALRSAALLGRVAGWSIVHWLVGAFSYWLAALAFDIDIPFVGALFLQSVVSMAAAIPSAPGFFGAFEAAFRVGLVQVWGIEASKAVGCALAFHIGGFIPITLIGFFYAWRLGISFRDVEHSEDEVAGATHADEDPGRGA